MLLVGMDLKKVEMATKALGGANIITASDVITTLNLIHLLKILVNFSFCQV